MIDDAEEKEVLNKSSSNMANESNFMTTQKLFRSLRFYPSKFHKLLLIEIDSESKSL